MPLTQAERDELTSAQLTQVDRIGSARLTADLSIDAPAATVQAFRARILKGWARMSPAELRARVNIVTITYTASGPGMTYASESDYTVVERQTIADAYVEGKGIIDIAGLLAKGISLEQRVAVLEARLS